MNYLYKWENKSFMYHEWQKSCMVKFISCELWLAKLFCVDPCQTPFPPCYVVPIPHGKCRPYLDWHILYTHTPVWMYVWDVCICNRNRMPSIAFIFIREMWYLCNTWNSLTGNCYLRACQYVGWVLFLFRNNTRFTPLLLMFRIIRSYNNAKHGHDE